MKDIHDVDYPEIDIPEDNNICACQDFQSVYKTIPGGRYGIHGVKDYTEMIKLIGPHCGMHSDYGNGPLLVRSSDIPQWLYAKLGIKPNRRKADRRVRNSGAINPFG